MLLDLQIYMPTQNPLAQEDIAFAPRHIKRWIKALSLLDLDATNKQAHQLIASSNRLTYLTKQRLAPIDLLQPLSKTLLNHLRRFLARQKFLL